MKANGNGGNMQSYKDLIVWEKSIQLVISTYEVVKKFPKEEMYALSSQIRRAAVSVPSNIAEGHDRNFDKEFCRFLCIARGSLAELETQLIIASKLNYADKDTINSVLEKCDEIGKMLNALIKKTKD